MNHPASADFPLRSVKPELTRRQTAFLLGGLLFSACPICTASAARGIGCNLSRQAKQGMPNLIVGSASPDDLGSEISLLNTRFRVRPYFAFYDDSDDPNAYASPDLYDENFPDGTVLFGKNLRASLEGNSHGRLITASILAHEWAHIKQYQKKKIREWVVQDELSADFLAGWYFRQTGRSDADLKIVESSFGGLGDTEYTNPEHHGTPRQRGGTFRLGTSVKNLSSVEDALRASYVGAL